MIKLTADVTGEIFNSQMNRLHVLAKKTFLQKLFSTKIATTKRLKINKF